MCCFDKGRQRTEGGILFYLSQREGLILTGGVPFSLGALAGSVLVDGYKGQEHVTYLRTFAAIKDHRHPVTTPKDDDVTRSPMHGASALILWKLKFDWSMCPCSMF
ncbi:hypothetical protein EVAR_68904_1 [Eumeta japonica]|uniref:Uncharacterized protein n=1 Tax=Eumeta variegata TaxID=151549 RepID=A0A4C1ZVA1_EUMVA|nr:hypothetical protein EVAR_68904_1 [Eumeta japonica]